MFENQENCKRIKCNEVDDYSVQCTDEYCANKQEQCATFLNWRFIINESGSMYAKTVLNCTEKTYVFKSDYVCMNGKSCFIVNGLLFRTLNGTEKIFEKSRKKVDCLCPSNVSVSCGVNL